MGLAELGHVGHVGQHEAGSGMFFSVMGHIWRKRT